MWMLLLLFRLPSIFTWNDKKWISNPFKWNSQLHIFIVSFAYAARFGYLNSWFPYARCNEIIYYVLLIFSRCRWRCRHRIVQFLWSMNIEHFKAFYEEIKIHFAYWKINRWKRAKKTSIISSQTLKPFWLISVWLLLIIIARIASVRHLFRDPWLWSENCKRPLHTPTEHRSLPYHYLSSLQIVSSSVFISQLWALPIHIVFFSFFFFSAFDICSASIHFIFRAPQVWHDSITCIYVGDDRHAAIESSISIQYACQHRLVCMLSP